MELNENITHCNEEKLIFQGKKTKNKNAIYFCLKNQRKTLSFEGVYQAVSSLGCLIW